MKLRILSSHVEISDEVRRTIERGTRLAIGRYSITVEMARFHLTREPAIEGRESIRCGVRARLGSGELLLVDEQADEPQEATLRAARRLERILRRRGQIANGATRGRPSSSR